MYTNKDHTFVICAYKENPHIEMTIKSLLAQSVKTNILLSTSTPNDFLKGISEKYDTEMVVNPERKGAGCDWNFGYMSAKTDLVTIVHQDDIYEPDYAKYIIKYANLKKDVLLLFTDYYELRIDEKVTDNRLLKIKRIMLAPLSKKYMFGSRVWRNLMLAFGDCISCPTVTYVKSNDGKAPFNTGFVNSCDYKTFVDLAHKKGSFIYIPKLLVGHRIYPESATTRNIGGENIRKKEDLEILSTYWPRPLAKAINGIYSLSEKSNEI